VSKITTVSRNRSRTYPRQISALFFALLVSSVLLLSGTPIALASTCSSTGGYAGGPYYYAFIQNTDSYNLYGVGTNTTPYTWTFDTDYIDSNRQNWAVNLKFPRCVECSFESWAQTGYMIGTGQGETAESRLIYFEFSVNGADSFGLVTGYTIPDNDAGYAEVWQSSQDAQGRYIATAKVYSPSNGISVSTSHNMEAYNVNGKAQHWTEAVYPGSYSGDCNVFEQYTHSSGAVYTTSVSSSEPKTSGTSWSATGCWGWSNYPYSIAKSGPHSYCYENIDFWGG
jgi:hypothetical protein